MVRGTLRLELSGPGESSPNYTFHPFAGGVPERAAGMVPQAKLVYLVRDPVDRVVSHYQHRVAAGQEDRDFAEVIDVMGAELEPDVAEPERIRDVAGYLARSLYFHQLDQWRQFFPDSQIRVIDQAELLTSRRQTLSGLAEFLGVADDFDPARTAANHNQTEGKRRVSSFGAAVRRGGGSRLARMLPQAVRRPLVSTFKRTFDHVPERPELTAEQREKLTGLLQEDAQSLRAHTGLTLDHWSV